MIKATAASIIAGPARSTAENVLAELTTLGEAKKSAANKTEVDIPDPRAEHKKMIATTDSTPQ
jgi:hypothetical protein